MSSSEDLMRGFGLLTTSLTVLLLSTLLWTGEGLDHSLLREAAVRVLTLEGAVLASSVIAMASARRR